VTDERLASHELPATAADADTVAARDGKIRVSTISLCGCWGCTLSILDVDERIVPLLDRVTIVRSSLTDIKRITGRCAVGFVEGGVANEENIETLEHFREHCDVLISVGACAIWGGVPSLRNAVGLGACLAEAYLDSPTAVPGARPTIPLHPEIPRLTTQVFPCHEVVKMDYFIPGCPPDGDAVFAVLDDLASGRPVDLPRSLTRFD
jgi:NAD-reducing hydrogenase small subunit